MPLSDNNFESWCFRNGGETYEEQGTAGIVCQFPDAGIADRIGYYEANGVFEIVTSGRFYQSRSLHQHADSWIDDDDCLHIDTSETRVIIDPSA